MLTQLIHLIPSNSGWKELLIMESKKSYFLELSIFLEEEYKYKCQPSAADIFKIFFLVEPKDIKAIILGQDPYSTNDMADGIAFSVKHKKISKSLKNIIQVIQNNGYECKDILGGNLEYLVKQGVFLINTCLTVRENMPSSHCNKGWEIFTLNVINYIINLKNPVCIMLWGNNAKRFSKDFIANDNYLVLENSHPSPLGFYRGFRDSKDFIKCNEFLEVYNIKIIDWGGKKCFQQEK